jgi:Protein of unknown function (DUF4435)
MFSRTSSGIRNTDLFNRNQYLVILEGQDDVPFWNIFFPKEIDGYTCKFKPVGGSEIKNYVQEAYENNARFAVVLDSDYRLFMKEIYSHTLILETIVHSIENIMISPQSLSEIIQAKCRIDNYDTKRVEIWLEHFNETNYGLMIADYLLQKECLGKKGLGKNCFQFLENQKTKAPVFDSKKIEDFIADLGIIDNLLRSTEEHLKDYKPSQHIRGHFFFGASLCFLNHEVNTLQSSKRKVSIANDDLYTMLILSCKNLFSTSPELQNLHLKAVQVAQEVVKILADSEKRSPIV